MRRDDSQTSAQRICKMMSGASGTPVGTGAQLPMHHQALGSKISLLVPARH